MVDLTPRTVRVLPGAASWGVASLPYPSLSPPYRRKTATAHYSKAANCAAVSRSLNGAAR